PLVRAAKRTNAAASAGGAPAPGRSGAVLPGNRDGVETLEKPRRKKAAQPQVDAAKQKAIAALQSNRMADARTELNRMKALDPDHPAVALLEPKIPAAAAASASPLGGLPLEPDITFG